MMLMYKGKYRIESARLKSWDYSTPWWYFVTICTNHFKVYFGKIEKCRMVFNKCGQIADKFWQEIPDHFPTVELDEYIIMPNHIHGIIILNHDRRDVACNVSTTKLNNQNFSQMSPPKNSLSVVIRSYKSAVTRTIRESGLTAFKWQPRFYDRIIRNEKELYRIRKYIQLNPVKWDIEKIIPATLE